jgi:L-lactate dehydrogenase
MKISVVGIGKVGQAVCHALTIREMCRELVLVNRTRATAKAEAMDLSHASAFGETIMQIRPGDPADVAGSDIVVLCASVPAQDHPEWTRTELAKDNWKLYGGLVPELIKHAPDAIYLVVANPVDVLTYRTLRVSGLPPSRVIGTGTLVDSARYRKLIARETGVHPMDIRAYIIGEHGDTQVLCNSIASIAGEYAQSQFTNWDLFTEATQSAYEIFHTRGYTNYGVAKAVTLLVQSIENDACHTLPVSTLIDGAFGVEDVCLSLPCVVGERGVHRVIRPAINDIEIDLFRKSAEAVRAVIETCAKAGSD